MFSQCFSNHPLIVKCVLFNYACRMLAKSIGVLIADDGVSSTAPLTTLKSISASGLVELWRLRLFSDNIMSYPLSDLRLSHPPPRDGLRCSHHPPRDALVNQSMRSGRLKMCGKIVQAYSRSESDIVVFQRYFRWRRRRLCDSRIVSCFPFFAIVVDIYNQFMFPIANLL